MPDVPESSSSQSKTDLENLNVQPTEAEIASTISKLEENYNADSSDQPPTSFFNSFTKGSKRVLPGPLWLITGVILPAFVVMLETTTGFCAGVFFDPIPTTGHVLLAAFVPVANLLLWLLMRQDIRQYRTLIGWLNGIAIGSAAFYTLVFLPLMPLAVIALIIYGLGILPMVPMIALITSIRGRRYLRRWPNTSTKLPGLWPGLALALIVLGASELPGIVTRFGMHLSSSSKKSDGLRGLQILRSFGDTDLILRNCYARQGRTDFVGFVFSFGKQVSPDEARRIYYQVTGQPFNEAPRPDLRTGRGLFSDDGWFDADRGLSEVGGMAKDLSLVSSRMDQAIDADACVSYLEWTLVFKNNSASQQEARTEIALPPDSVVSRLTLWVNGEEREAAFASRGKVQQAYQQVVAQRRDPVLVTTSGPDRILVQCFPVPPNGGEMKVRLGITSPLQLEDREHGSLSLPHFRNQNFGIDSDAIHALWIESKKPISTTLAGLKNESFNQTQYALRGTIKDLELAKSQAVIRVSRASEVEQVLVSDPHSKDGQVIRQTIEEREIAPPSRIVLVIDGSVAMRQAVNEVAASFSKIPDHAEIRMVIAGDDLIEMPIADSANAASAKQKAAEYLRNFDYAGGRDNVPALVRAWDLAAENQNSTIVWIHGPQPVLIHPADELKQRWERHPSGPMLYDLQFKNGPNEILESLESIEAIKSVPQTGKAGQDLEQLFSKWNGPEKRLVLVRDHVQGGHSPKQNENTKTVSHLARLWARDEVQKMIRERNRNDEAVKLASTYQIVTLVTGAVVLETQEQYNRAGLEPVKSNSVPTIPEPETWLLIAIVTVMLMWLIINRRQAWKRS